MAKSAQARLTDPSFPPELRLQVMAAGVQYGPTHWHADLLENIEGLRDAAFSSLIHPELWDSASRSFNPTWLDEQARGVLAETAEQAFLENAVIGIGIDIFSVANEHKMDERTASSPLLISFASNIETASLEGRFHHLSRFSSRESCSHRASIPSHSAVRDVGAVRDFRRCGNRKSIFRARPLLGRQRGV
jgi:hypothetical protein